jgi:NAD(P)-dependent dehydrogenase (short-subunit alcohol dehydrogenase family)
VAEAKLAGKTAVVTGGGSGIGRAICVLFAREGARVALLDVDDAGAEQTVGLAGGGAGAAAYFRCDVSSQAQVDASFAAVAERFGPVDVLVNNAGIAHVGTLETTGDADMDRLFAVNVKGVFHCLKAGVAQMRGRGGAILNMASVAAMIGIPDRFAYMMTKSAVMGMTLSVARDYVDQGIRCNAISPARVHTPFVDGFLAANYPGREAEMFERLSRTQPLGRMGTPEEVAKLALYLCSDDASFITGSNFPIDGGFTTLKM